MANTYLSFISDEHLLNCVGNLYQSYQKAKNDINKKKFYSNKIDAFKMVFDVKFNTMDEEALIHAEILRQIDKSINNSIGTFHEEILGGIAGYEKGNLSGFDIKAVDNTLFADIKNKHNTMNISAAESLFQKLKRYADDHKQAKCYWVQILATQSFCEKWTSIINGKEYSHSRVYKISGDQFYQLLTGVDNALFQLYSILPKVIEDYLKSIRVEESEKKQNSALNEIKDGSEKSGRTILNEITYENYQYYLGFDKL